MLKPFLSFLLCLSLAGCATTGRPAGNGNNANTVSSNDVINAVDLSDYLRRVTGVQVTGDGPQAVVSVRGPISFNAETGPLYVVNGSIMGYDYSQVYNSFTIEEVKEVRVLKDGSDTGFYGTRGAAGVIEIDLKRSIE